MGVHSAVVPEPGLTGDGAQLNAAAVASLPPDELDQLMGPERSRKVAALSDWLIRTARGTDIPSELIGELCAKLREAGLPLDRYGSTAQTLDAEHDAISRLWLRGQGVTERTYVRAGDGEADPGYLSSPYYAAAQTRQWVELRLDRTADSAFGIVPELKESGFTHYVCVPILLMSGANGWVTFATRDPPGFTGADLAVIARIIPTVAILIDLRSNWIMLHNLLRTYVGDEPHHAILRGNTKRGQVSTIKSAMLFADMRDSVGHTADMSATQTVDVFNQLFDTLVPPIESRHGEVLKYIGDGLLAIFREAPDVMCCDAAARALAAAEDALRILAERNLAHSDERPIHIGIALHYGEAAYGNVGSGIRLDFTVIGRDVNLASRIAGMNRTLGEPLLMSRAFVDRLRRKAVDLGAFPARGFKDPVEVFRPGPTLAREPV